MKVTDYPLMVKNFKQFLREGKLNESQKDVRIEYPSMGTTYNRKEYGVYEYSEYPRSSVLAGEEKRVFLDSFETLDQAKKAYPHAEVIEGSSFQPRSFNHLSDDDDY